jgi:hypothetical protein
VDEAVALCDEMARLTTERHLFSANDVLNFCLDIRNLITAESVIETVEDRELVPA